ncbi:hypothetical protein [Phaeacidiphilus oryzae]|uniref:hypothetical protein n=1 Tax=Phaeacidiphilus oryzae TaxID=348818 RepID=UPI00055D3826|nr:hypothetical protein [Phaeacidiphilus oryzae]
MSENEGNERRAERIAGHIRAFAREHGEVQAVVEYVGAIGTRIALVAGDGSWGDQVAPDYATAKRAVELSGAQEEESFEGELGAKVRTSEYEWRRMAGSQLGGRQPAGTR